MMCDVCRPAPTYHCYPPGYFPDTSTVFTKKGDVLKLGELVLPADAQVSINQSQASGPEGLFVLCGIELGFATAEEANSAAGPKPSTPTGADSRQWGS